MGTLGRGVGRVLAGSLSRWLGRGGQAIGDPLVILQVENHALGVLDLSAAHRAIGGSLALR